MATSPIYGWLEPDNTDLVKNGALAIRTLGDAIDTTMATMTPKSIVDAKGDLVAASANDTPARLAVGSNFAFLQADSSTATGLVWNNAAWISYTPTITASSGTFTTTTTTLAKYARIGKTCVVKVEVKIVNAGTAGGNMKISLPFNSTADAADLCVGTFRESGNTGILGQFRIYGSIDATNALAVSYNNTTIIVNGSWVSGTFIYEVA